MVAQRTEGLKANAEKKGRFPALAARTGGGQCPLGVWMHQSTSAFGASIGC